MTKKRRGTFNSPIGVHEVPEHLVGSSRDEVKSWARGILNGEEPDLDSADIAGIRRGELRKVFLQPKKKGFFADDGVFIEAFEYSPEFGEDLDEAEEKWELEETERKWIDEENNTFNRKKYFINQ